MTLSSNKVLRTIAIFFQVVVALVFIVAAGLKALDPAGFAELITSHRILPASFGLYAAWFFICVEFVLAGALLFNLRPGLFIPFMILLLLLFIGVTAYSIMIGVTGNCGCFGNLVQRTPQQVILEDVLMIAALLFSFIVLRDDRRRSSAAKTITVSGLSLVFALLLTGFGNRLPVDSFVTELRPGKYFSSWPVEGLFLDLNRDQRVVFLFSVNGKMVEEQIRNMNAIAQSDGLPPAAGLIIDGSGQLTTLVFQYGTAFPVGALEPRFARALYRSLPRTFLLDNGTVRHVWSGVPSTEEVKTRYILMKK